MGALVSPASSERGTTLIETMVALTLLLIVLAGVVPMGILAISTTDSQDQSTRTNEYAQAKLEQLLALSYTDTTANTAVAPTSATGGPGLAIGGSLVVTSAVVGYVDYLSRSGAVLPSVGGAPPVGAAYKRVWQISSPKANLKQLTVTATLLLRSLNSALTRSTISTLKTCCV